MQQPELVAETQSGAATLPALIRRHALERPQAPAIVTLDAPPVSYRALLDRVASMDRVLRQAGIGRDSRIAVQLPTGGQLASVLASVLSHAVAVPLDPRLTDAELDDLRARLRIDALLTASGGRRPGDRLARRIPLSGDDEGLELHIYGRPQGAEEPRAETSDSIAMILRTSGTTAEPKLVPLTHRNLMARAERLQRWLGLGADDRALSVAPLHYAHGLETALFAPLAMGGSLACPPPLDQGGRSGDVLAWLAELEPTYYSAGPTFHRLLIGRLQAARGAVRHRLRLIQSGGAPLAARDLADLESLLGVPVLETYGLSESGQLASNGWAPERRRPGTVGPTDEGLVTLRGEDGTVLPASALREGMRGEIMGSGPSVTPGYLDRSGAVQPIVVDGWFATGDLGVIDTGGFLRVTGRLKDIVNRGGEKIAPAEVDQALLRHPDVAEAATFAVPHARLGEDLAAAVVLRPDATATALDLRHYLAERLVPFKVPRRVHLVDQLPKGNTGKVSRAALTRQFAPREQQVNTRSTLEYEITRLWARLLGRERVDPTADFFELGGDSLLAVEMRLELERLVGSPVPEQLLFDAATARQVANAIVADDLSPDRTLVPLRTEGDKAPLLFCDGDLGGGGYYMRRIAAKLDADRPLWLLRPVDIVNGRVPTIETMAARYLSLVRQAGIRPPYVFGGHCNGALIALECARQAEAAGEAVPLVIMVDPISLNARRPLRFVLRTLMGLARLRSRQERKRQDRLGGVMAQVWALAHTPPWRRSGIVAPVMVSDHPDALEAAFDKRHELRLAIYHQAMARYLPRPVAARIVCLTAEQSSPRHVYAAAPWARFGSALEEISVPGGHLSCLTAHSETLARKLREALAAV